MKVSVNPTGGRGTLFRLLLWIVPLLLVAGFLAAGGQGRFEESRISVRYLLFAWCGFIAILPPYISFPDPSAKLCQLLNLNGRSLLRHYLARHRYLVWIVSLLLLATVLPARAPFVDRLLLSAAGLLFLVGIWLYSASAYLMAGRLSQEWQESEKGRELSLRLAAIAKYPVDAGSIPSLIISGKVALTGMLGVVAGAFVSQYGGLAGELAWSLAIFLFGLVRILKLRTGSDRHFYRTNAFFSEFFGTVRKGRSESATLSADQLWWVPGRWRAGSWALLTQMDRKLPAGRLVMGGHLFIWILAYRGLDGGLLITFWILFALLHQGLVLISGPSLIPSWLLHLLGRPYHWAIVRFWVQVRWLLPLVLSMSLMMGLFARFGWGEILLAAALYLIAAGLAAGVATTLYNRYGQTYGT